VLYNMILPSDVLYLQMWKYIFYLHHKTVRKNPVITNISMFTNS